MSDKKGVLNELSSQDSRSNNGCGIEQRLGVCLRGQRNRGGVNAFNSKPKAYCQFSNSVRFT